VARDAVRGPDVELAQHPPARAPRLEPEGVADEVRRADVGGRGRGRGVLLLPVLGGCESVSGVGGASGLWGRWPLGQMDSLAPGGASEAAPEIWARVGKMNSSRNRASGSSASRTRARSRAVAMTRRA
jgi:hypothetical protein